MIDFFLNSLQPVFVSAPLHLGCDCIHGVSLSGALTVEGLFLVGGVRRLLVAVLYFALLVAH